MTTATAVDVAADVAALFKASRGKVVLLDVPELLFASVDGRGAPGDESFAQAVGGLYTIAYGVRFALRDKGVDEKVSALEALWWTADPAADFAAALAAGGFSDQAKDGWSWRAMIRLPWAASDDVLTAARAQAVRRHPEVEPALAAVHVGPWREGLCVQTMHVGPYAAELPTVVLMHDFIAQHGLRAVGHHHEVYLGDPRRTAPDRLRTILRQPVGRVA